MVISKPCPRLWLCMFLLACFLLPVKLANAALTASVDRTVISNNDIITLTIRSDTGPIEHTDFSTLEKNFSVINRQRSNQITIINGRQEASYDLTLTLFPKTEGLLTIPAFTSQGESSLPIQIKVKAGVTDNDQEHGDVFLETEASKPTVYVQEQLLFNVRLFHAVGLSEAQLTPLEIDNAVVQDIGEQKKYQTVRNGIRYSVIEKHYSITPQKSGQLAIPELIFTGRTAPSRSIYGQPGQYVRSRSTAQVINVLPKPASYPADQLWLPTSALYIADSWDDSMPTLTVGEPVTRTLTLTAINLDAAQLPDLKLPNVKDLKMYPDQVQDESNITAAGLVSRRSFSTAIVPTKAGDIEIPAVKVVWWNTDTQQLEETIVAARTLSVVPAAQTNRIRQNPDTVADPVPLDNKTTPPASTTQVKTALSGVWPWISLLLALLWFATLFMWWQSKQTVSRQSVRELQNPSDNPGARTLYNRFKKACRENDAKTARQALLDWFSVNHSNQRFQQLTDITHAYQDDELTGLMLELEAHLYGNEKTAQNWHGSALAAAMKRLQKTPSGLTKNKSDNRLKPLYPL